MTITRTTQSTTIPAPRWHFVLHGGCNETCPDPDRQLETRHSLHKVASQITEALGKGATAREAVVLAVSALEDCATFNAGHGAALDEDGTHQVSPVSTLAHLALMGLEHSLCCLLTC